MAEPRRKPTETEIIPLGGPPRPRPRVADGSESPGEAPVQAQIESLNAALNPDLAPRLRARPVSDLWRIVIIVGASLGLWAGVYAGAWQFLTRAG